MKTYKVLARLLDYPSEALLEALPELRSALEDEALLPCTARGRLDTLWATLAAGDAIELQETYGELFDRIRSLSLNLFEHVHGESRDRGQALVDLKALYARHGFELAGAELPDYLPAFLEFLSCLPQAEAAALLAETSGILEGIAARLGKRHSPYAAVFEALLLLAGRALPRPGAVSDAEIEREDDPAVLDAAWEEQPAFGPGPGCAAAPRPAVSVVQFQRRAA